MSQLSQTEQLTQAVCRVHSAIRAAVVAACESVGVADQTVEPESGAGDLVYPIDRVSEAELLAYIASEVAPITPVVVVGEGLPNGQVAIPEGTDVDAAPWRMIVDPIDGTRGLMYQKRSAWILTGIAPNRGSATTLRDIVIAVQTEIPLIKQHLSDQLWALRGHGTRGVRWNRLTGESVNLAIAPSRATSLRHGYATICRFFPGGRDVSAAIDDALATRLLGPRSRDDALVFEDQYACTGGQVYGLAMGQDRLIADLRPLLKATLAARGEQLGHCCHPYDICTALVAQEAGAVIRDPHGDSLTAPLDTATDVGWIGYANQSLREHAEPVLLDLLAEFELTAGCDE